MRRALWLLALPLSLVAAPAVAQSETVVVTSSEIRVLTASEAEARAAGLEQAYRDAQAVRPRRGVILSSVLLVGGAGLLGGGVALSHLCLSGSSCRGGGIGAASLGARVAQDAAKVHELDCSVSGCVRHMAFLRIAQGQWAGHDGPCGAR